MDGDEKVVFSDDRGPIPGPKGNKYQTSIQILVTNFRSPFVSLHHSNHGLTFFLKILKIGITWLNNQTSKYVLYCQQLVDMTKFYSVSLFSESWQSNAGLV